MRAIFAKVPPALIEERKRTGADQWNEMWEGVLHRAPMPNPWHQELEGELETWLRLHWGRPNRAKVLHQINLAALGGWPNNYRVPDLLLLTPDRSHIHQGDYFEGPPNVVVEIHSPDDETYEKLDFYVELAVPEVWVIDRDTGTPEVFVLAGERYQPVRPGADGWIESPGTRVQMRRGGDDRLASRMAGNPSTEQELPPEC
jgi:Uma2 family endonuclease